MSEKRRILIIGAGLSTGVLVEYLNETAIKEDWEIRLGDKNFATAKNKAGGLERVTPFEMDVNDEIKRLNEISRADIVVSMLPAHMHLQVARECIALNKHMVTASYVSAEMAALDGLAKRAGVVIMNEIGVDPGIDHMSAVRVLNEIKAEGGNMLQFETFTGGLPAPGSDDNPWRYKFAWNPRNVVLAGSGAAVKFRQEGQYKYIPYHQVFRRTELIDIPVYGKFEGYANRDSLKYREAYGINDIPTIYRGTLRRPGFCRAWDVFVKLGATDDSYVMEGSEKLTYRQFINSFLAYNPHDSVELKLMHYLKIDQDSDVMDKLESLDLFKDIEVGIPHATPAQILQHILEQKWTMTDDDRDMVVMYHLFGYELGGKKLQREAFMVKEGESCTRTAMALTVGLPVAVAVKMILKGKISTPGIQIPVKPEVYNPVMEELSHFGITFDERHGDYRGY
ncbi:MAG: saccharopine dehydrogenase C-terminal domain-containing protein [Salibacteraceae bacterium]